ncbi:MAG: hypothetical protein JWN17_521 [Frankiales bacterium]|nr:hypothetical protein [Frankiales bacterium]
MSTASNWLRDDVQYAPRSRLQKLRRASTGALVLYGTAGVVVVLVLMSVASFVVKVHDRGVQRQALEDAAVKALPPGSHVELRGVYAEGAATGYATAFSTQPPKAVLAGLHPAGREGWTPVPGTDTVAGYTSSRAWLSASQKLLLTVDATSCASDRVPVGCPDGGSTLRVQVAPGGPKS